MPYKSKIPGWMSPAELEIIVKWSETVPINGIVVEVGSLLGRSSSAWGMSCHNSVCVYCIDMFTTRRITTIPNSPWNPPIGTIYDFWKEFLKNTADIPTIIPIKASTPEEANYKGDPIDIFFIDAWHKNPSDWNYIKYFSQFVKVNGMICGHDYGDEYPDVVENAKKLAKLYNTEIKLYESTLLWSVNVTHKNL